MLNYMHKVISEIVIVNVLVKRNKQQEFSVNWYTLSLIVGLIRV